MLNQGTIQSTNNDIEPKKTKGIANHKTNRNHQLWLNFTRAHGIVEQDFEKTIKSFFNGQRKRALEKISKSKSKSLQLDWEFEDRELMKKSKSSIGKGVFAGSEYAISLGFEVEEELAAQKLKAIIIEKSRLITQINRTVQKQIDSQLMQGIEAGENVEQLSDRIRSIYNMTANRAKTIARTETTGAMNAGSKQYAELGGARYKQWITAGDGEVRDFHEALDGEIVSINDVFSNGLDVPGGMGDPAETINCRCTLNYLTEKDND
jgi:SPP1 gp7 family putative phage head morphogenesis protein